MKEGSKGVRKEGMERREGRRKGGGNKGEKVYVCSCVCNCKTEHATVGLLGLFLKILR